mgnify:CR=1 FL=1
MREKACVVEVNEDTAKVVVTRHSACSKCNRDCILGMEDSHEQDEMYVEVKSKRDVEVGDTVNIELKDSSLVIGSFIIYLIPLILFVVGYFIGARLSFLFGALSSEATGIISSFIFLYLSYLLTKRIDKRISQNKKFQSEIVNIISKNENI